MDPVAHTLVGAALAETGLKRLSRYATATLVIGANLPDVDIVASFWGSDASLYFRRGWSHGILALLLWPFLLTAAVWCWHRWRGRTDHTAPPFRPGLVLALAVLGVWSHPLLDWLNNYGVRLLMPFDGRWFYGDTLFIIDPWLWLLLAAGVLLARSASSLAIGGWAVLAIAASAVIVGTNVAPFGVKLAWLAGLALLLALRWKQGSPTQAQALGRPMARISVATLIVYICAMYGMARVAESTLAHRFPTPLQVQANPAPGVPFAHRTILVYDTMYRIVATDGTVVEVPRQQPDAIVQAALASASIRGFANWMRFPVWRVKETPGSWIVRFWDLRYQMPDDGQAGVGFAEVEVPKQGGLGR